MVIRNQEIFRQKMNDEADIYQKKITKYQKDVEQKKIIMESKITSVSVVIGS